MDTAGLTREQHPKKTRDSFKAMQAAFVDAWHTLPATLSRTERARRASILAGYSETTAKAAGAKLLTKPSVVQAILDSRPAGRVARNGLDAAWLLSELADLWEIPLSELFDHDGRLLDIDQMPYGVQKLISAFEVCEETSVQDGRRRVTTKVSKIKLIDRLAVLDKIARNYLVSAYTSPEQRSSEASLARLLNAIEKNIPEPERLVRQIDAEEVHTTERSLADVIGSQDE